MIGGGAHGHADQWAVDEPRPAANGQWRLLLDCGHLGILSRARLQPAQPLRSVGGLGSGRRFSRGRNSACKRPKIRSNWWRRRESNPRPESVSLRNEGSLRRSPLSRGVPAILSTPRSRPSGSERDQGRGNIEEFPFGGRIRVVPDRIPDPARLIGRPILIQNIGTEQCGI